MLPKPQACVGCPAYGDGMGFCPDVLLPHRKVLLMGQNPGKHEILGQRLVSGNRINGIFEAVEPQPMIGWTGQMLERDCLPLAGLTFDQVNRGNVMRCRWKNTDKLPPPAIARKAIAHCQMAYGTVPSGTEVIVALGGPATWALTGHANLLEKESDKTDEDEKDSLSSWRGFVAPHRPPFLMPKEVETTIYQPWSTPALPVFITIHPAALMRQPGYILPSKHDWQRLGKLLRRTWPKALPFIHDVGHPTMWADGFAFDTEYDRSTKVLSRYNICTKERMVYVVEALAHDPSLVPVDPVSLVGQNLAGSWDLRHGRALGLRYARLDDTSYEHAVLWPGYPHDLNYLSSLYGSLNRHKHLAHSSPVVYAGADAVVTLDVHEVLSRDLDADPRSRVIYEEYERPLIELIDASSSTRGLLIDQVEADRLAHELKATVDDLTIEASHVVGYPIQLSSNVQVARDLYKYRGITPPKVHDDEA